ncbi:hypothetical protein GQ43DRAFT_458822 [Delitschia confertaspora ATCC 74209]|uniref:Uncharacterized protein n=1 Tax=Delitschia confertaspora ATCC 74209 TaxID=1513339 RepID=A0A9P4JHS5_9PLEO|nr:hypothetical protein GQ43DRAFT_458822 [Delitschia confertaspora ATCC 74209]
MASITSLLTGFLMVADILIAKPTPKLAEQPIVTYLGSQGPILYRNTGLLPFIRFADCLLAGGAFTTKGIVYTAGTVLSLNSSIITGGTEAQTAQVIKNIAIILEEAGTAWDYVYAAMLPPKPARTIVQAGKLPGDFLVVIEAIAAIPDS